MDIHAASKTLSEKLNSVMVGAGVNEIYVYWPNKVYLAKNVVPKTWEGFPVVVRKMGKVSPLVSNYGG